MLFVPLPSGLRNPLADERGLHLARLQDGHGVCRVGRSAERAGGRGHSVGRLAWASQGPPAGPAVIPGQAQLSASPQVAAPEVQVMCSPMDGDRQDGGTQVALDLCGSEMPAPVRSELQAGSPSLVAQPTHPHCGVQLA